MKSNLTVSKSKSSCIISTLSTIKLFGNSNITLVYFKDLERIILIYLSLPPNNLIIFYDAAKPNLQSSILFGLIFSSFKPHPLSITSKRI